MEIVYLVAFIWRLDWMGQDPQFLGIKIQAEFPTMESCEHTLATIPTHDFRTEKLECRSKSEIEGIKRIKHFWEK